VERTHPVYASLSEQLQSFMEYLQDLPKRHFVLKVKREKAKVGKSLHLPNPQVDPTELVEVEQEYLRRYFRSKPEMERATAEARPVAVSSGQQGVSQSVPLYQSIHRRERLRVP
jgi:hypothetical protein